MKITEALVAEHTIFLSVFDEIERALPRVTTQAEVGTLAAIVEGLLSAHADTETNLAYLALDHALADKAQLERLYQDHHELDQHLARIQKARTSLEASRLLSEMIRASREHFRHEERWVFPLLERNLQPETLQELGIAWMGRTVFRQVPEPVS